MAHIEIDGSAHTGMYGCSCGCGFGWTGVGEQLGANLWSPALPFAEAVVHNRQQHPRSLLEITMSHRLEHWLLSYWEYDAERRMAKGRAVARPTLRRGSHPQDPLP